MWISSAPPEAIPARFERSTHERCTHSSETRIRNLASTPAQGVHRQDGGDYRYRRRNDVNRGHSRVRGLECRRPRGRRTPAKRLRFQCLAHSANMTRNTLTITCRDPNRYVRSDRIRSRDGRQALGTSSHAPRCDLRCYARRGFLRRPRCEASSEYLHLAFYFSSDAYPGHLWDAVGDHLATLCANGLTIPLSDVVIGALSIQCGLEVWARDRHFPMMQNALPRLKLYAEPP